MKLIQVFKPSCICSSAEESFPTLHCSQRVQKTTEGWSWQAAVHPQPRCNRLLLLTPRPPPGTAPQLATSCRQRRLTPAPHERQRGGCQTSGIGKQLQQPTPAALTEPQPENPKLVLSAAGCQGDAGPPPVNAAYKTTGLLWGSVEGAPPRAVCVYICMCVCVYREIYRCTYFYKYRYVFLLLLFFPGEGLQTPLQAPAYSFLAILSGVRAALRNSAFHTPPAPAPPPGAAHGPSGAARYRPHGPATARRPRGRGRPTRRGGRQREPLRPKAPPRQETGPAVSSDVRPSSCAAGPPRHPPPARGLPLPVRAAASGLSPFPHPSPRTCPRPGGAESRQPRPCGGGKRLGLKRRERGDTPPPPAWPARTCRRASSGCRDRPG